MTNVERALDQAREHHQAGRLDLAVHIYRHVLARDPDHLLALLLMATWGLNSGNTATTVDCCKRALGWNRELHDAHAMLAEAYRLQGDLEQATFHCQQAIKLNSKTVGAHVTQGMIHFAQGNPVGAVDSLHKAIRLQPNDPQIRSILGELLFKMGKLTDAEVCLKRVTLLSPDNALARFKLGVILQQLHRPDDAAKEYEEAVRLNPGDTESRVNLGAIYNFRRQYSAAETQFRAVLEAKPDHAIAHTNLGGALVALGRFEDAVFHCRRATQLRGDLADGFFNEAAALQRLRRFEEASEAIARYQALDPNSVDGFVSQGVTHHWIGESAEAVQAFRRAVELQPDNPRQHSNLIYGLHFLPENDPVTIYAEHVGWGKRHADPLLAHVAPHVNDRKPDRRLRVGYVSGHFSAHAVNFFVEPILAAHDHNLFEVFCYSNVVQPDEITAQLQPHTDHWRDIYQLSDELAAQLVRKDQIDILVDLAGHLDGGRLMLFARKPAPVQVTYLGYQNTTGMQAMDYRLTDEWSDPPGWTDSLYTEKLVRLPQAFFTYLPTRDVPLTTEPPSALSGHVTFGSFNNLGKVTPQVLAIWADILHRTAGSRLIVVGVQGKRKEAWLRENLAALGISTDRVELFGFLARAEYLAQIDRTDVALDPFPFNGHTTTCDTFWMGVPVVTLAGQSYVTRFGSSAHIAIGLQELIATTPEQYAEIAVNVAGDVQRRTDWRHNLRRQMSQSPICDAAQFTRNLEAAYRRMWQDWCAK